jgi:hypothetical protein
MLRRRENPVLQGINPQSIVITTGYARRGRYCCQDRKHKHKFVWFHCSEKSYQRTVNLYVNVKSKAVPVRHAGAKGERSYSSYSFLISALDGSELSVSPSGRTLFRGNDPAIHCIGGWVGIRIGLDREATGKVLFLCRGLNPSRPVCSQTLHWLSYHTVCGLANFKFIKREV